MAVYYVRTDGHDGANGVNNTTNASTGAWQTIDHAVQTVSAGDTIRVQAGTYVETANHWVSGTSGNYVTLVADGSVTTCGMSFSGKSYIRVIGFTMNPNASSCGGSPSPIVAWTSTNTGLEFWNNDISHLTNGHGIGTTGGDPARCNKCIILGGTVHHIGDASGSNCSMTAISMVGDDNLVGYVDVNNICYIGVGPSGSRSRFLNLYFNGLIQFGSAHPDFYYISVSSAGYTNNLVEATYGVGTITSTDNKFFHAQNDSANNWLDNVWRFNVAYNMGSGYYSMYATAKALTRWQFYNDTIVNCDRAQGSDPQFTGCGNMADFGAGPVVSSVYNTAFYQAWGDGVTTNIAPWGDENIGTVTVTKDYNLGFDPDGSVTFSALWDGQSHEQSSINPNFTSVGTDFTLTAGSGNGANARGTGGPLTTATSCSGTTLNVASGTGSKFIGDNGANLAQYGGKLVPGDFITVNSTNYQVSSVSSDALTLASSISCSNGDAVYFGKSSTIDIGAYPYKAGGYTLTATYTNVGGTVTVSPSDSSLVRFIVCYEDGIPVGVANTSPYTFSVGSGTIVVRAYHKYASTTFYAQATSGVDTQEWLGCFPANQFRASSLLDY